MPENTMARKLRAIFEADAKGYSRLMGDDEKSTVETITVYRKIVLHRLGTAPKKFKMAA